MTNSFTFTATSCAAPALDVTASATSPGGLAHEPGSRTISADHRPYDDVHGDELRRTRSVSTTPYRQVLEDLAHSRGFSGAEELAERAA
jgi:hypothetical protein